MGCLGRAKCPAPFLTVLFPPNVQWAFSKAPAASLCRSCSERSCSERSADFREVCAPKVMRNALLLLLIISGSNAATGERLCATSGELVALRCPGSRPGQKAAVVWTTPRSGDVGAVNGTDLLVIDGELLLLRASDELQQNYSCSNGHNRATFDVRVYARPSRDCEYNEVCTVGQTCTLYCPTSNTPKNTHFSSNGVTWQQGDKTWLEKELYFSSVKDTDRGVYTCRRSFQFGGQVYNMTFTKRLDVGPQGRDQVLLQEVPPFGRTQTIKHKTHILTTVFPVVTKQAAIISPRPDEVFSVDVGARHVINCTASVFEEYDRIFWTIGESLINTSGGLRVSSSNSTKTGVGAGETKMSVSLIFREVSEEDLSTVFTCKLDPLLQKSSSVNVTLARKERLPYVAVAVTAVVIPVVMLMFVLIYIKYKVDITLFLRDTLGCHRKVSDGKSFDAFIMSYTSEQGPGLSGDDRRTLQSVLEEQFGYSLCLFHRDVLPGNAAADAVLECVEQSRVVVLVPASPDLSSESALLAAVHEALVERQSRLVLIQNKSTKKSRAEPQSQTLQLLMDLGHRVTWRGSLAQPSFFWKQLRYYLPPVREPHRISLLPQAVVVEDKQS